MIFSPAISNTVIGPPKLTAKLLPYLTTNPSGGIGPGSFDKSGLGKLPGVRIPSFFVLSVGGVIGGGDFSGQK
jgi:hypothetical protein